MRLPLHADLPRWLALFRNAEGWEYANFLDNYWELEERHVASGVMRWRTPEEGQRWYRVAPMPAWEYMIHWDRDQDIITLDPDHIVDLYRKDNPTVQNDLEKGYTNAANLRENAAYRIRQNRMYNDPYMHATDTLRMHNKGYQRVADLLGEHHLQLDHLWQLGLVRNRPNGAGVCYSSALRIQVHPLAVPHLYLWQRWQDVLIRPGQQEHFQRLWEKVRSGAIAVAPWPHPHGVAG